MKRLYALLKGMALSAVTVLLLLAALWCCDRALPHFVSLPLYTPALSTMGKPHDVYRLVSADFDFVVRNNALGLRGPEIDLATKKAFRIAVYGSSYTYGWGVNEEDSFVSRLGQALNASGLPVEMINLGRNGGSPPQYAALAKETIPLVKPDLVIVAVGQGCDLRWSGPMAASEWYPHVLYTFFPNLSALAHEWRRPKDGAAAIPSGLPTEEQLRIQKEGSMKFARETYDGLAPERKVLFNALDPAVKDAFLGGNLNPGVVLLAMDSPDLYAGALDRETSDVRRNIKWLRKHLASIARAAKRQGAPTVIVSVPFGGYVNDAALENMKRIGFEAPPEMRTSTAMDDSIRDAAVDLLFLNATDVFRARRDDPNLFFSLDLHMSAPGHKMFAESLAPRLAAFIRDVRSQGAGEGTPGERSVS